MMNRQYEGHAETLMLSGSPAGKAAKETVKETPADVESACGAAAAAAPDFEKMGRAGRAVMLRAVATALQANEAELVSVADSETGLGRPRLSSELVRTSNQLRHQADVIEDGGYLEAIIDHAEQAPDGRRPDLRRMLVPVGPVAVFGASNFPFAYSVVGGDTASALAAGCPVVIKGHSAHPQLSKATFDVAYEAIVSVGAPEGVLGLVFGHEAGQELVGHPAIRAVGFTGSLHGGRALFDIASLRRDPIPFYGELGSINPVVVSQAAAEARAGEIGHVLAESVSRSAGQYCTKPGLVFVPDSEAGLSVMQGLSLAAAEVRGHRMLTSGIRRSFLEGIQRLSEQSSVQLLTGASFDEAGEDVRPSVYSVPAEAFGPSLTEEHFGPATLVVTYADETELMRALKTVEGSLTATLFVEKAEEAFAGRLADTLLPRVGRLVWNAAPNGLRVGWATNHGGPWPASTAAAHTSVGGTAVRRFLRPVAYQDAPRGVLPPELRDDTTGIMRRIDGKLTIEEG